MHSSLILSLVFLSLCVSMLLTRHARAFTPGLIKRQSGVHADSSMRLLPAGRRRKKHNAPVAWSLQSRTHLACQCGHSPASPSPWVLEESPSASGGSVTHSTA